MTEELYCWFMLVTVVAAMFNLVFAFNSIRTGQQFSPWCCLMLSRIMLSSSFSSAIMFGFRPDLGELRWCQSLIDLYASYYWGTQFERRSE